MFLESDVGLRKGSNMAYVATAKVTAPGPNLLPDDSSFKENSTPVNGAQKEEGKKSGGFFRSASHTSLSKQENEADNAHSEGGFKRVLSEHNLQRSQSDAKDKTTTSTLEGVKKSLRRHSIKLKKEPKIAPLSTTENGEIKALPKAYVKNGKPAQEPQHSLSVPSPAARKRSTWILGASRSPSPSNRKALEKGGTKVPEKVAVKRGSNEDYAAHLEDPPRSPMSPRQIPVPRDKSPAPKSKRPLSAVFGRSRSAIAESQSKAPPLPKSFSTDRLPTGYQGQDELPELPKSLSKDQFRSTGVDTPRKKDELWSNFRALDADFHKFASKTGHLKSGVVRSALLPFLRQFAEHSSNMSIRAEDLDRRANILNKWWTGLLEMLNGRNGQSISGNDRPAVLEGLSSIMSRPEWQLTLAQVSGKPDKKSSLVSKSTTSLGSDMSDFLAESVIHNVRNIFVQNLLSQMAFVVDRMSQRTVPASVVAFCGKACAYAFFHCPGVAEVLIRLWSISSDTLRRVLDEYGIPRNFNLSDTGEIICQHYPHHLRNLYFSSVPKTMRSLRNRPPLPMNVSSIPWNGPWINRWSGRDSDLFFCFVKHFHVLTSEVLPEDLTVEEQLSAPSSLLVKAQLLSVMDATVHRSNQGMIMDTQVESIAVTFDDLLGADASAMSLTPRAPNAVRSMAENRLVMLLREFLSDSPTVKQSARKSFASLFDILLKAAAKRVSVYDHDACFTLCDLLEECIAILSRYHRNPIDSGQFLDFDFWFKVLKEMGESNNSMTEVRLFAFVYRFWGFVCKNDDRKRELCLNWFLREDYTMRQFNHWCPMVRTYYMRVLCWKMLRFDGEGSDVDLEIFKAASTRLRTIWSHFLFHQQEAHTNGKVPISTAPSNPAPGRRMLIIRDDSAPAPTGTFHSFDSLLSPTSPSSPGLPVQHVNPVESLKNLTAATSQRSTSPSKKRWPTLRNINPFSSSSSQDPKSPPPDPAPEIPASPSPPPIRTRPPALDTAAVKAAASAHAAANSHSHPHSHAHPTSTSYRLTPLSHSFKFSLEWADRGVIPRDRKLSPPRLPQPAQLHLQANTPDPGLPGPKKPMGAEWSWSKYCGRALAEWGLVVQEYQGFVERRLSEGVKGVGAVEVPSLGVESLRKL